MTLPGSIPILPRIKRLFRPADIQVSLYREMQRALALDQSRFPEAISLPDNYGKGLPERAVEILIARLTYAPGKRVLDVGYANIMKSHAMMLRSLPSPRNLTGIDIAEPVYDASEFYQQAHRADITHTPFDAASFDLVWCISSLEHFGMDNSGYTADFVRDALMDAQAVREMLRIVAPAGQVLITVPYGRYEDLGTQRNYDREHWQSLLAIGRPLAHVREWYFRHTFGRGWHEVDAEQLRYVGYYDQANAGAGGLAVALMTRT